MGNEDRRRFGLEARPKEQPLWQPPCPQRMPIGWREVPLVNMRIGEHLMGDVEQGRQRRREHVRDLRFQ